MPGGINVHFTHTEFVLLGGAAKRTKGILSTPSSLKPASAKTAISGLLARRLIRSVPAEPGSLPWKTDTRGRSLALRITKAGRLAAADASVVHSTPLACVGVMKARATQPARKQKRASAAKRPAPGAAKGEARKPKTKPKHDPKAARSPRPTSKLAQVVELLRQPGGASIADIVAATGWQRHTVRGVISAAIRGKLNLPVTTATIDGRRTYQIDA